MLELRREDKGGSGLRKMDIIINNKNKGNIKDLGYKIYELNKGPNSIYLKSGIYKSKKIDLIYEGNNTLYNCGFNFSVVYTAFESLFKFLLFVALIALNYNKQVLPFNNQYVILVIGYFIILGIFDVLKKKYFNGFFIFQENGN